MYLEKNPRTLPSIVQKIYFYFVSTPENAAHPDILALLLNDNSYRADNGQLLCSAIIPNYPEIGFQVHSATYRRHSSSQCRIEWLSTVIVAISLDEPVDDAILQQVLHHLQQQNARRIIIVLTECARNKQADIDRIRSFFEDAKREYTHLALHIEIVKDSHNVGSIAAGIAFLTHSNLASDGKKLPSLANALTPFYNKLWKQTDYYILPYYYTRTWLTADSPYLPRILRSAYQETYFSSPGFLALGKPLTATASSENTLFGFVTPDAQLKQVNSEPLKWLLMDDSKYKKLHGLGYTDSYPPAVLVDKLIQNIQEHKDYNERYEFIIRLRMILNFHFPGAISQSTYNHITTLKTMLQHKFGPNYLEALYNRPLNIFSNIDNIVCSNTDAQAPISLSPNDTRFTAFVDKHGDCAIIQGNTFISTSIETKTESMRPMDIVCIRYLRDGVIFALADGCGGHMGSAQQDAEILLSAKTAVEQACLLGEKYPTAALLKANAELLLNNISQCITKVSTEKTTLLIGRAFLEPSGMYNVVTINVGDGLLATYHNHFSVLKNLAPLTRSKGGIESTTAMLPNANKNDILIYEQQLPANNILLLMSDGVSDFLPQLSPSPEEILRHSLPKSTTAVMQEHYSQNYLDESRLSEILLTSQSTNHTPQDCVVTLANLAIANLNKIREKKLQGASIAHRKSTDFEINLARELELLDKQISDYAPAWAAAAQIADPEQQKIEKLRLSGLEKQIKNQKERLLDTQRTLAGQAQFQLGDDFTIAAIKLP